MPGIARFLAAVIISVLVSVFWTYIAYLIGMRDGWLSLAAGGTFAISLIGISVTQSSQNGND